MGKYISNKMLNDSFERLKIDDDTSKHLARLVGDEDSWTRKQVAQAELFGQLKIESQSTLLEIGCGPCRFGIGLIDTLSDEKYFGLDISSNSVAEGEKLIDQLQLRAQKPTLVQSNLFGIDKFEKNKFDVIWAYNVLIHLSQPLVALCFYSISTLLKPDGRAFFTIRLSRDGGFVRTGKWLDFPITAAPFSWFAQTADETGLIFQAIKPISSLEKANAENKPAYYLASLQLK